VALGDRGLTRTPFAPARVGELQRADERDRHVGHDDAGLDGHERRRDLPQELPLGPQVEDVVERTDDGDQDGAAEHRPRVHDAAVGLV